MTIVSNFRSAGRAARKEARNFRARTLRVVGHSRFTRFIILSRSRTGSNMLLSFLRSHPNIVAGGELFQSLNGRDYRDILDEAYRKDAYGIKAKGFKIFYSHPFDDADTDLWHELVKREDLHVIHLKRRNMLRTLISWKFAYEEDVWLTTDSVPGSPAVPKQVSFSVSELSGAFEKTQRWEEMGDSMFRNHPTITVHYEDLASDPESGFRRITDFLGVPFVPPRTRLRKQNPGNASDLIANYDELRAAFAGTRWQPFFESEP